MSSITFSLIQTSLYWEAKQANLDMLEKKISNIGIATEVVVLPEMFSTGFSMNPAPLAETMDGPTVKWMKRVAFENRIILTGSMIIEENGYYYNRLMWVLPNGQFGHYDKRHLFAFAGENAQYTAGDKRLIASVKGWKINLQVCYDLRFPVWSRQSSGKLNNEKQTAEYDVILYVANWPESRSHAWKTLLTARAIENQCYVVAVNRTGLDGKLISHKGDSMVIDPLGEILYHKEYEEDIYTIHLHKNHLEQIREKFPFWKDADQFNITHE